MQNIINGIRRYYPVKDASLAQLFSKMEKLELPKKHLLIRGVYFPFGLYLAPYCGYAASLLVGIGVFLLQVWFCKWWLGRHKQGPLESIWHKWTWIGTGK